MRTEKQRILWVYTDELDYVKNAWGEKFKKLKNIDNITYEKLTNSTVIVDKNCDGNDITSVIIIHDFDNLSHIMLIELVKLIQSEKVDLIYTNKPDQFKQCYTSMVGPNTDSKHPSCDKEFMDEIQKHFKISNFNIAIISDDNKFISHIITDLLENVNQKRVDNNSADYYGARMCMELDSNMPKIVQQWVYNVWYAKKPNLSIENNEPMGNLTNAKLFKVITVNVNDEKLITYHFINPYRRCNLSECINHFDILLIDMQTHYSLLNFGNDINFLTIIPFIKGPIDSIMNPPEILNIINNMITFSRGNYKSGHNGRLYNDYHYHDKSHSIKVTQQQIEIDNINILKSISPFDEPKKSGRD